MQLTNVTSKDPEKKTTVTTEEQWLKNDQLQYLRVLKERKEKKEATDAYNKSLSPKELRTINIGEQILQGPTISPDGRFVGYRLTKPSDAKSTIVPNYVTESADVPRWVSHKTILNFLFTIAKKILCLQ
jgi:hypothetical protein